MFTILKIREGFYRIVFLGMLVFGTGCATVILDNDVVMNPPIPDTAIFKDPVCVKLNFKTDNLNAFNQPEGVKVMGEMQQIMSTTGLQYFNIMQKCDRPVAEYTITQASKTRNWWARSVWFFTSVVTLGIIPFYVEEVGTISVADGDHVLATSDYREKRLSSIFAIPKWIMDDSQSIGIYRVEPQLATNARREAVLIKLAIESKVRPSDYLRNQK